MLEFALLHKKEVLAINEKDLLKKYFGYDDFRPGQAEIIENILKGRDCLGIMPTGAGKSICYQIPSLLFPGVTIVISPLISLMKDQVDSLNDIGISATFINSSLSHFEYEQTIENIINGVYKIIYVAPERLESPTFVKLLDSIPISMFAIDEAHCVSQWGHDFRPTYQRIADIILNLKVRPVVTAFTATATEIVKNDIIHLLHLSNPFVLTTGFDRTNLSFSVEKPFHKTDFVLNFVKEHEKVSGIIYCLTRKSVDALYDKLFSLGYLVSKYHAGMAEKLRAQSQEDFVYDRTSIMIATNAFGMGIDKSNIRYVIHYNMPRDLESYYQEAGRAGRDGDNAKCILLFSRADIVSNKFLIEQSSGASHKVEYDKLNDIVDYCNTDKCLRRYILEYFGEIPLFDNCENCGNCLSEIEITDITSDAQKILSCIKRVNERFGTGVVTDVLKGSRSSKLQSLGFDKLSTYGIMSEYSKDTIKDLIYYLMTEGYIDSIGDKYPVLTLSPLAGRVLFGDEHVLIKKKFEKAAAKSVEELNYDMELFEILRSLRKEIAEAHRIPPFIVFPDTSLKQMASYYPTNAEKMLQIDGVGAYKIEKYGDIFVDAISDYVRKNEIVVDDVVVSKGSANKKSRTSISPKEESHVASYQLYLEGKSIDEIATIRGLTCQTIENHLLKCFELGMEISLEKDIHMQFEEDVYRVIEALGTEKLKPLKEALPREVSYFDIKYFVIKHAK